MEPLNPKRSFSVDWLSADRIKRSQAQETLRKVKDKNKGKWFKDVLVSKMPQTWKVVECKKGEPGAYQIN